MKQLFISSTAASAFRACGTVECLKRFHVRFYDLNSEVAEGIKTDVLIGIHWKCRISLFGFALGPSQGALIELAWIFNRRAESVSQVEKVQETDVRYLL